MVRFVMCCNSMRAPWRSGPCAARSSSRFPCLHSPAPIVREVDGGPSLHCVKKAGLIACRDRSVPGSGGGVSSWLRKLGAHCPGGSHEEPASWTMLPGTAAERTTGEIYRRRRNGGGLVRSEASPIHPASTSLPSPSGGQESLSRLPAVDTAFVHSHTGVMGARRHPRSAVGGVARAEARVPGEHDGGHRQPW